LALKPCQNKQVIISKMCLMASAPVANVTSNKYIILF